MLDLEERLTRHYTDVATAPTLHRRSSVAPRLALAGLVVALIAGAAYVSGLGSTGEDIIAGPGPDSEVELGTIDPELLRLLERAPYDGDRVVLFYLDMNVVRQGSIETADGNPGLQPLEWAPGLPMDLLTAMRYPEDYRETYGYGFEDVDRALAVQSDYSTTVMALNGDASAALDRALAPTWSLETNRYQEGPFDILDWGDEFTMSGSTDVRPIGESGQLAAVDGNIVIRSIKKEWLDPFLATAQGGSTVADQEQLMNGLEQLSYEESLGVFVSFTSDGHILTAEEADPPAIGPTLWIIETGLDGSSRLVMGFLAGTDVASVEERLRAFIAPTVDVSQLGIGTEAPMATTITRSDELIVIDFTPNDPSARFGSNDDVRYFMGNLLFENPEILSSN